MTQSFRGRLTARGPGGASAQARAVKVPGELTAAMESDPEAARIYEKLAPSHRREYCDWVGAAKQESTRQARAQKALSLIRQRAQTR